MSGERIITTITSKNLINLIKCNSKIKIIDVRDQDYNEFGHIIGSVNFPTIYFSKPFCEELIKECEKESIDTILTYCKFGIQRSVNVANTLNKYINSLNDKPLIQISYLENGFSSFKNLNESKEFIIF